MFKDKVTFQLGVMHRLVALKVSISKMYVVGGLGAF